MRSTHQATATDSPRSRQMLRKAIAEARLQPLSSTTRTVAASAPCACDHHAPAPVPQHSTARVAAEEAGATLHRGFKAAPVVTAIGAVVGVVVLLSTVTALLLAVALTALALSVVSLVLLLVVRMLRNEMSR